LRRGNLGEVTHSKSGFTAELRGLAHALNQPRGRLYQFGCDAVLGDARCGVDLDDPGYAVTATVVSAAEGRRIVVSGAGAFDEEWFMRGRAEFISGANAGRAADIKNQRTLAGGVELELWHAMPMTIVAGDSLRLRAGCDKQFTTCRAKFSNGMNFRGFPHIPGDDFILTYVSPQDSNNDGESRNPQG
jgi:uncharacterized phage protein (TIGR02218 family)